MAKVELPDASFNYPSNSNISQEQSKELTKPKAQKIVKGKVITKKPSFGRKFKDVFLGEESSDVKGYILLDVIIPSIKDLISDVITGGLDLLLFGEHRSRGGRRGNSGSYTSYSSYYDTKRQPKRDSKVSGVRGGGYYVRDIIFSSRGEAEEVLGNMIDTIKDYGMVSVGDLYDMVGEAGAFTDNAWGWFDLGQASVRRVREGYMLALPRVVSLK